MVHPEIEKFLEESPSLRRARLGLEFSRLRDRHDDLLADHARMVHASESGARVITQALSRNLKRLDAVAWQLREEQKAEGILRAERLARTGGETGLFNAEHADLAE
jgi:hypothetical protein